MMKTTYNSRKGFTLIEMIGVLAIIGILASVVAPRVIESIRDAKVTSAISSVNAAKTAVLNYYQRYDRIPLDGDLITVSNNRPGAGVGAEAPDNGAGNADTLGHILYFQELLLEEIKTPIGESLGTEDFAIGCTTTTGSGVCGAGGSTVTYANDDTFSFKSAGNATRIAYYFIPNLTKQEAAALGTKVNGPFPVTVQGEDDIIAESTIGTSSTTGANCWFSAVDGSTGTYDAYLYVAHQ